MQRRHDSRWLPLAVLAGAGGGAMALTAMLTAAFAFGDTTALIMGGSGVPVPPPLYVSTINDLYLDCVRPLCTTQPLTTPEGLYPITGVKTLPTDTSIAQGLTILNGAIGKQLADGHDVTVFGWSQSAAIASLEMTDIVNGSAGISPSPDQLNFMLVGDPSNPNGGLLSRFDLPPGSSPSIPSLGITFTGATPVTEYPTTIYTAEYDGFADFPRYPINFLSDYNALLGLLFAHTLYPTYTPEQLASAVEVPTSPGYDGATTYYMIPTEDLPLLDPVRMIPVLGPLVADLLQPDLTVLVNLGYGDPSYGWVNENADVSTPLGVSPSWDHVVKAFEMLGPGTVQGIENVINDLKDPAQLFDLSDNPISNLLKNPVLAEIAANFFPSSDLPGGLQSIPDALSAALSNVYATFLPLADIINAVQSTLATYDVSIFLNELGNGDLVDAIGLPLAANTGLVAVAQMFEIAVVAEAAVFVGMDLASPFTDVANLIP
ncbi:MAG TPA: PE-PPE domain-containing protein [Mycobacterium sp.]|nr:PE-PPE domain-containing protein [Mycobacterium sp.]